MSSKRGKKGNFMPHRAITPNPQVHGQRIPVPERWGFLRD